MAVRLLAVADIHSRSAAIQAIRRAADRHVPDAVIVAGDLTNYGDAGEIQRVLDSLPGRVLAIPGNLDVRWAFATGIAGSKAESLVENRIEIRGVEIAGLSDRVGACDVLVVHEPPRGILDDAGGGRHIGFAEHLAALNRLRPKVLLCGHCHESPGVVSHDSTTVVNCTLGRGGRGALVEIDGEQVAARML
jgi:Icc-related predicted phosphoesterase